MTETFCASCSRHVYVETVLKGPNKGETRMVSVNGKIHRCGIDRAESKEWTVQDKQFLRDNYGPMTAGQLAKKLDRSLTSVRSKISALVREGWM